MCTDNLVHLPPICPTQSHARIWLQTWLTRLSVHQIICLGAICCRETNDVTWHQDCDGRLHGFADDVVQSEHPVGLDVVVPQYFVHLRTKKTVSEFYLELVCFASK